MGFYQEVGVIILSYLGVMVLMLGALAWMTAGFLFPFLKVKMSRGKLVLVQVNTITQDYHRPGRIDTGFLIFKDRNKEERRIKVPRESIYRSKGINMVDVDDEKSAVMLRDYSAVSGFDGAKYNDLYLRALYKPTMFDRKEKIMLGILVIVGVLVLGALYLGYQNNELLLSLTASPAQVI